MATVQPVSHRVNAFNIKTHDLKARFTPVKNTVYLSMSSSFQYDSTEERIRYIHQLAQMLDDNDLCLTDSKLKINPGTGNLIDLYV